MKIQYDPPVTVRVTFEPEEQMPRGPKGMEWKFTTAAAAQRYCQRLVGSD